MPLRNQPYLPLYVQDYLTDEKLNSCSASSQGVYIKIMCILHKQDEYGTLNLFKQKDKQNSNKVLNFACKFAKLLPFDQETILKALEELLDEGVLNIDGDKLYQKRMVKDNAISEARSKAGKTGGGNPNLYKQNPKQTVKQNPENENENEIKDNKGGLRGDLYFNEISELEKELMTSDEWVNVTAKRHHILPEDVLRYIPVFCLDQQAKENVGLHLRQYKEHFVNWLGVQIKNNKPQTLKEYSYDQLLDMIHKNGVKQSDYELLPNKMWRHK